MHSINNPSNLPDRTNVQLARFVTRELGNLNNVNTASETDIDISNSSQPRQMILFREFIMWGVNYQAAAKAVLGRGRQGADNCLVDFSRIGCA